MPFGTGNFYTAMDEAARFIISVVIHSDSLSPQIHHFGPSGV